MAPAYERICTWKELNDTTFGNWRRQANDEGFVVEGWGEGFFFGSLMIMACITVANMRKGVFLHKLILLELLLAIPHGTFGFMSFEGYGWYLSATAALLYSSYFTHNVVAWIKIRPFFTAGSASFSPLTCKLVTYIYLTTLCMTAPITVFQISNNFRFFNNIDRLYTKVRPYEPLFRDPWWLFSVFTLFHVIRTSYNFPVLKLVHRSPRFGILLAAIFLSMVFTLIDVMSTLVSRLITTAGINPYWKLALVFKCLTDNIMLDDFKTALKKLGAHKVNGAGEIGISNMSSSEKTPTSTHNREITRTHRLGRLSGQDSRTSISGRVLDHDEVLGQGGSARRKTSTALGRVGTRIAELPPLPSLPAVWRTKAAAKAKAKAKRQNEEARNSDAPLTGNPSFSLDPSRRESPHSQDRFRQESPVSPRTTQPSNPYGHTSQYYGGAHDGSALPDTSTFRPSYEQVDFITMMSTGPGSVHNRNRQFSGGGSSSSSGFEKMHHTHSR